MQRHSKKNERIINQLFTDFLSGQLTEEGLIRALQDFPEEAPYIEQAIILKGLFVHIKPDAAEVAKAWAKVKQSLSSAPSGKQRRLPVVMQYAAAVLLFIAGGLCSLWLLRTPGNLEITTGPDRPTAYLELSDGRTVDLENPSESTLNDAGMDIHLSRSNVVYKGGTDTKEQQTKMNTLKVPYGTTYRLTLADGTIAWVNAGGELKFPVAFGKGERHVRLRGEAYFEVKHSSAANRFVVETDRGNVEVLGTSLNISSYSNEKLWHLTLVTGKARFRSTDESQPALTLKPSQQVRIDESLIPEVVNVDTRLYTSWIEGMLVFENAELMDIVAKLERWYNIHCVFADSIASKERFTGSFQKDDSVSLILSTFNATERIRMSQDGKSIRIKTMNK